MFIAGVIQNCRTLVLIAGAIHNCRTLVFIAGAITIVGHLCLLQVP